jgi:hypothetical protein
VTVQSFAGQGVVGEYTTTAWWPGNFEVTQGWGPSSYSGEPEGHGYTHWHAGADIGVPCGTLITLPVEIPTASVRWVDNPGGYGTALVVTIGADRASGSVDIWLGHLATRLAAAGPVRGGTHLAASNSSGNSTGCHVHFEVRPAGARYGTDVDPTRWILDPAQAAGIHAVPAAGQDVVGRPGSAVLNQGDTPGRTSTGAPDPLTAALQAAFQPVASSITQAEQQLVAALIGSAQVGLGSLLMGGGVYLMIGGMRGQSAGQLGRSAVGALRSRREGAAKQAASTERAATRSSVAETAQNRRFMRASGRSAVARGGLTDRGEIVRDRLATLRRARGRGRPVGAGTADEAFRAARARASRVKGAKLPELPAARIPAGAGASVGRIRPWGPAGRPPF